MKREQVGKPYIVSARMQRVLQRLVFVIPLFVIAYGITVSSGIVPGSRIMSSEAFYAIAAITTVVVFLQMLIVRTPRSGRAAFQVFHHLLLGASLIFVFGILSPVTTVWLILAIATMTYFGRRWAFVSILTLILTMTLDLVLLETDLIATAIQYALLAVIITTLVVVYSTIRHSESIEREKVSAAEARQTKQREALLTIINGTNQAIFTLSNSGIIRIYNSALLGLLDTNDSLSGKNVDDILNLHTMNGEPVSLRGLIKSDPRLERDDLMLRFADGDEIRLQLSVNKIQTAFSAKHKSGSGGYVCIARDITKEKNLDDERDEFISVVSHELRTPVAIAEGTLSNLQFFLSKGTVGKRLEQSVDAAYKQISLLSNLINDLGTLSRAERGAGDDQIEIDVKEMLEGLYRNYRDTAGKKGLALNLDLGPRLGTITTSRIYLEEVLQNFLTNALKYTDKGSVTLHAKRKNESIEFAVSDTGIGISKSDLKHVFEKFYRSEDYRTRETSGTGLGLYVVAKLMRKLGANVTVTSRLNHGSTFSFTISDQATKTKA